MPRLIKLRSQGDVGYFALDDVKTVRQRLADRDSALKEVKDLMRRKASGVLGEKLRKHDWRMTGISDLPGMPLWQEEELEREAKHCIQDEAIELERSPPPSPGRDLLRAGKDLVAAVLRHPQKATEHQPERDLRTTPQSTLRNGRQTEASEDQKTAPTRQDTVMASVEAPQLSSHQFGPRHRDSLVLTDRKPVCTHCWDKRQWCDSLSLCGNCKASGARCTYMQCRSGAVCRAPRCVYIHTNQWSDQDPNWQVEEGSLRYKYPLDPRQRMARRSLEDKLDSRDWRAGGRIANKRPRSPSEPDALEDGFIRKSVCTRCYDSSTLCDFNGRCNPCRDAGMKCVRIHCKQGLACRARKCPCVHPGQYDLMDTTWNVEHGQL